jgi:hypothetical protein
VKTAESLTAQPTIQPTDSVDKQVLRSLILQYFGPLSTEQGGRRVEILVLITKVLDFGPDDRAAIGLTVDPVTGNWKRKSSLYNNLPQEGNAVNDSLADKWISFLLNESKNDILIEK